MFQAAYDELTRRGKVGGACIRALTAAGLLAAGAFWVSALSAVMFACTEKLLRRVQASSRTGLNNVFGELPRRVWLRRDGVEVEIDVDDLQVGDVVVAHAGEPIPVDGTIVRGAATIDQQALTGEAQPVERGPGESVFAATIVLSGSIDVRVDRAGAATLVASIEDILLRTSSYTSQLELKGKVIADRTVVPTLALSALTLPLLGTEAALCMQALYPGEGMRVLGPVSLLNFLRRAAEQRILVKDGRALESLQDVDTVVFDKTGTLTEKIVDVARVHPADMYTVDDVLARAAAVEARQTHPVALAIRQEAAARGLDLPAVDEASYEMGMGISAVVDGVRVRAGSARYLARHGLQPSPALHSVEEEGTLAGHSFVYVAAGDDVIGAVELRPRLRPGIKALIAALHARGLAVCIVSGDREAPTRRLAEELGIDRYFAATLPHQKADLVAQWQAEGRSVCFVGDGINDAIALKRAHVSVSLAGASTIAADSAQIVFMDASLEQLVPLFRLADELAVNMRGNLAALLAPSPVILVGVFFLGMGYISTSVLVTISSIAGILNAAFPGLASRAPRVEAVALPPARVPVPDREPAPEAARDATAILEPQLV
ncbi:MAG: heavy metal translocating P-type ATPase [Vicinamibacterales bacterium]